MPFTKRNTILVSLPECGKQHLHIVLTDSLENSEVIVITNISTYQPGKPFVDETTILDEGDHSFINRKSYVVYDRTRRININVLERLLAEGKAVIKENVTEELYQTICNGLLKSKRTPADIKKVMRKLIK